ncbi:major capsid protein [Streptomyces sp. G1]|uniref:major capsid protein n=1 Tax=Streptomyces sp. G1 TaxID=361572 RepID=UPI00203055DD|nr:major capsid protein [Streptomyces sp. G1]MCM1964843.1 major capsid protein [Streptomyces sp. G1]
MDPFELPETYTALTDAELSALHDDAVAAFEARSANTSITSAELDELRALAAAVQDIRAEQSSRTEAAAEAAAEIDALAAQVRGEAFTADTDDPEAEAVTEAVEETEEEPEPVTAAAQPPARPALNLAAIRAGQRRIMPAEQARPGTRITASVDVPGHRPGAALTFDDLTSGTIARANALKTVNGGKTVVASYAHPFPPELIVTDAGSAPEGTTVSLAASNQRRLPQRDLVASGGWCAPSETVYDIADIACPDMLWDAPEIQLSRGGLRYFKTPTLDVAAITWVHTEADDIAGNTKPCFTIPCPDPLEVRCDAVGVCLESGILTQRHFPELTAWYLRNAMVAHEIRVKQELFAAALATATPVAIAVTFGALSPIFAAVALQAADMIERHSLCEGTALEVVFPWWSRNLFLADLARRNGVGVDQVNTGMVQDLFSPLGVRIQWARSLPPAVPAEIGGATPAVDWPATIQFLIYPAGTLQIGRGAEVNLGVIHDSVKFSTNDYTALFTEECNALVDRSVDTRVVTVPVCPSGETGAQTLMTCPAA